MGRGRAAIDKALGRAAPKPRAKAKPKAKATYKISGVYRHLPANGGIMRVEPGDYICTSASGVVKVKPPSVFKLEGAE